MTEYTHREAAGHLSITEVPQGRRKLYQKGYNENVLHPAVGAPDTKVVLFYFLLLSYLLLRPNIKNKYSCFDPYFDFSFLKWLGDLYIYWKSSR